MRYFTPGPWYFNEPFGVIQLDNGLPILAKLESDGDERQPNDEVAANGRLMAAAPELLQIVDAILYQQPVSGPLTVSIGAAAHSGIRALLRRIEET